MNCFSCKNEINESSYVTRQVKNSTTQYHTYCYFPQMLKSFKKSTRSYVSKAIEEITSQKNFSLKSDVIKELFDDIEEEINNASDDIIDESDPNFNLPSAA